MDPGGRITFDLDRGSIFHQRENGGYRRIVLGAEGRERHRKMGVCLTTSVK